MSCIHESPPCGLSLQLWGNDHLVGWGGLRAKEGQPARRLRGAGQEGQRKPSECSSGRHDYWCLVCGATWEVGRVWWQQEQFQKLDGCWAQSREGWTSGWEVRKEKQHVSGTVLLLVWLEPLRPLGKTVPLWVEAVPSGWWVRLQFLWFPKCCVTLAGACVWYANCTLVHRDLDILVVTVEPGGMGGLSQWSRGQGCCYLARLWLFTCFFFFSFSHFHYPPHS